MSNLLVLNLSDSLLAEFPESFKYLKNIQTLDIGYNIIFIAISHNDSGAFDKNSNIEAIRLDGNHISMMDGLFLRLSKLTWLNISDNLIKDFNFAMNPRTVQWFDISHNKVQELSNYYDISSDLSMTYVNAGYNSISALASKNLPDTIETFLDNFINISNLMPYTFSEKNKTQPS